VNVHSATRLGFVVDQINQAVSNYRNWNEEIEKVKKKTYDSKKEEE
jgi:hypothetical protein